MIRMVRFVTLIAVLLIQTNFLVLAEERSPKVTNYEFGELEITVELKDIIDSFQLRETEIVGSLDGPAMQYLKPWGNPDPFLDEDEVVDLTRRLINQSYAPLDHDVFLRQIAIINGIEPFPNNQRVHINPISARKSRIGSSAFSQLVPAK